MGSNADDQQALATSLIDEYTWADFAKDQRTLDDLLSCAYRLRRFDGSGHDRQGYVEALRAGSDYELVRFDISEVDRSRTQTSSSTL